MEYVATASSQVLYMCTSIHLHSYIHTPTVYTLTVCLYIELGSHLMWYIVP